MGAKSVGLAGSLVENQGVHGGQPTAPRRNQGEEESGKRSAEQVPEHI